MANHSQPYCPRECLVALSAMQYDEVHACARMVVLGCFAQLGGGSDAPCFKSLDDGRLVLTTGAVLYGRPGWVTCSDEERETFATTGPCTD
ncbi:MAG: hypothetical protein KF819_17210 [Labilithrix sp.]|nr:hypothetical protein [Labilithrix sp.]